jgi:hypothetical protein
MLLDTPKQRNANDACTAAETPPGRRLDCSSRRRRCRGLWCGRRCRRSGPRDSTTGEPAEGCEDSAPDRNDPAGTGGSSASVDPEVAADPVGPENVASVRLASVEGGRASFALEDGSLYLLWATPQAGFVVSSTQPTEEGLAVAFTAARGIWLIEASVVDGEIVITSGREPFT